MSKKIYIKFGNIKGNVQDPAHKDFFDAKSMSFKLERNVTNVAAAGRNSFGTPTLSKISISKAMDNNVTADIFTKTTSGTGEDCIVHLLRGGDKPTTHTEYILKNAALTSYYISETEGDGDAPPTEQIEISFTRMECNHTIFDAAGKASSSRSAGFDAGTNSTL